MSQANVKIISHPSIRVKGTENDFDPVNCSDTECSIKSCHMHCPFCIKSESYHDSRILKAHYHVKHVDKGIEFGGLKILRCCEKCDIIGVIKEEKKFKGAHWHCFICKNGFNRRDEAIKHYKTHFRNPCTTLQIHVPQEVNKAMAMEEKKGERKDDTQSPSIHIVSEAVISSTTPFLTAGSGMSAVILKNTTDKTTDGIQEGEDQGLSITTTSDSLIQPLDNPTAIMIIQDHQMARSSDTSSSSVQSTNSLEEQEIDNKWQLGKMVSHLQEQLDQLQAKKDETERSLRDEIGQLKSQVHRQTQELELLQQKSKESSNITPDARLQQLLKNLQQQHTEMLQQHIKQVKQEVYQYALKQIQGNTTALAASTSRDNTNSTVTSCDQTVLALFLDSATGLLSQTLPVSLPSSSQTTSTPSETGNQVMPISLPLSLQSPYLSDGLTVTSLSTRANMTQSSLSTVSASTVMNSSECPSVASSSPSIQPSKINSPSSIYNPCLPSIQQLVQGVAINGDKSTDQPSNDKKLLIAIPSTLLSTPVSSSANQQSMISTIHPSQAAFASIDSSMISNEATNSSSNSFLTCSTSFAANCPTGFCTSEVTSYDNNTSYIITEGSKHCPLHLASSGGISYSELLSSQTEKRKLNVCDQINIEKRRK